MKYSALKEKYLDNDFKLKGEFQSGDQHREEVLNRAEKYAGWTLPNIFPDNPLNEYDEMQNDYQSVGAQAVINLANKILMALFQPSRPFFRMNLTKDQRAQIESENNLKPAEVDAILADTEREAMRELDKMKARVVLTEVIQHLIITGNALMYTPVKGDMYMYSLRDYTIKRDLRGNLVKLILRETKSVSGLSDELAAIVSAEGYGETDEVSIYTAVCRVGEDRFVVWQELEDVCYCHRQIGIYRKEDLPYLPLTWNLCRNKDYGTGLVENYAGDFHSLSTCAEAKLDYMTILTDIKTLVDPAGMTDVREITQAPSGAYVHGREEDLFVHSANVKDNANFLREEFVEIARRIGSAFLLNSAVTRQAERVTAEEIRQQAQELEGSLGGVYSRLAVELQLPLAKRLLSRLDPIFKDIEPIIVTGLESLSRNSELDRMRAFFQDLIGLSEVPLQVAERIDYEQIISTLGAGHGVDFKKFLLDDKVVQSNRAKAMQQNAQASGMEANAIAQGQANSQQ